MTRKMQRVLSIMTCVFLVAGCNWSKTPLSRTTSFSFTPLPASALTPTYTLTIAVKPHLSPTLTFTSCPTNSKTPTPQATITLRTPTQTRTTWNTPVKTPTLVGSKIGGITGVFASVKPSARPPMAIFGGDFYDLFRFYDDGLVLGVKVGLTTDTIKESWPKINQWLQLDSDIARGEYHVLDNRIWFNIPDSNNNTVATDYSGIYSGTMMILDSYDSTSGTYTIGVEYFQLDSENPEK